MIFLCLAAANPNWETQLNNLEASSTNLKVSLQKIQLLTAIPNEASISVSAILSLARSIESEVKSIENQINQMNSFEK